LLTVLTCSLKGNACSGIVSARTVTPRAECKYALAMNVMIRGGGIEQDIQTDDARRRICGFGVFLLSALLMGPSRLITISW